MTAANLKPQRSEKSGSKGINSSSQVGIGYLKTPNTNSNAFIIGEASSEVNFKEPSVSIGAQQKKKFLRKSIPGAQRPQTAAVRSGTQRLNKSMGVRGPQYGRNLKMGRTDQDVTIIDIVP